jgi:hypothetical protein
MLERPFTTVSQMESTVRPAPHTAPAPVITTREEEIMPLFSRPD